MRTRTAGATPQDAVIRRRGTAATECALVLPFLLIIAAACLDLARATRAAIVLSGAARAAAEYGATHRYGAVSRTAWEAAVRDSADRELAELGTTVTDRSVAVETQGEPYARLRVTVSASCHYRPMIGWPGLSSGIRLERQSTTFEFR